MNKSDKPNIVLILSDQHRGDFIGSVQLFDLRTDPHETTNLAERDDYREIVRSLTELVLQGWEPDALIQDSERRGLDQAFLTQWGRNVGYAHHELWNPVTSNTANEARRDVAAAKEETSQ